MTRLTLLVPSLLLTACAAPRASEVVATPPPDAGAVTLPVVTPAEPAPAPTPAEDEGLYGSRFTLKGGYYGAEEDALDDGYIFNVSWMTFLSRLFALELEVGYLDADGDDEGIDAEVWAAPVMLNGRFNVPVWVLEAYGGAGIGGFYYDAEASGGGMSADEDGFLWGANAFIGASINLAEAISLGLEGKYYISDDIDDIDDANLDAFALMLTLGFSR